MRRFLLTRLMAVPFAMATIIPLAGAAGQSGDAPTLARLQQALDNGRFRTAAEQSAKYLTAHPGNRDARFVHAAALAGQNDNKAAIKAFTALHEDFPLRVEPTNDLAVLYAREGDYDKARKWLEKAMDTQPAYAAAHQNLGDVYTALADLAYRTALGTDKVAKKVPLKMVDRFYYEGESVAPGNAPPAPTPRSCPTPPPQPLRPAPVQTPPSAPVRSAASSAPIETPDANASGAIIDTMRSWARAWSSQDVNDYLGFYGADFDPGDGRSAEQWRELRRQRLVAPEKIHIEIDSPKVSLLDATHARVVFVQKYSSPRYSDEMTKQLFLTRENGQWRITRESTASS